MELTQWALGLVLGALGGSLGTFVALRTKLTMMTRDISDETKAREAMGGLLADRLKQIDRRLIVALQLMADVAGAVNVDKRKFGDALVRMLSDGDAEING